MLFSGPGLQLLQAVAPVATAPKKPHDHQLSGTQAGSDVVIEHRRVLQRREIEGAKAALCTQGLWLQIEQCS